MKRLFLLLALSVPAHAGLFDVLQGDPPPPQGTLQVFKQPNREWGSCGFKFLDDQTILCWQRKKDVGLSDKGLITAEWQIGKDQLVLHPELDGSIGCVDPRTRRFSVDLSGNKIATGVWGKPDLEYFPRETKGTNPPFFSTRLGFLNPFSCKFYPDLDYSGLEYAPGMVGTILHENDGVISHGRWDYMAKGKEYWANPPANFDDPKYLVFKSYAPAPNLDKPKVARIRYLHWKQAYFLIFNSNYVNPEDMYQLLSAEGFKTIKNIEYTHMGRYDCAMGGGCENTPTKLGMLWSVNNGKKSSGIYLSKWDDEENPIKISDYVSWGFTVSPSGCRVIVDLQRPEDMKKMNKTRHTQVIEICK